MRLQCLSERGDLLTQGINLHLLRPFEICYEAVKRRNFNDDAESQTATSMPILADG